MAKHVLFILHGMGKNPPGWSTGPDGVQQLLIDSSKEYEYFKTHDLGDSVILKELSYDHVFDRFRNALADNSASLLPAIPESWAKNVFQAFANQKPGGGGDTFAWSHIGDVVLYRLLPNVHNEVISHLRSEVTTFLAQNGNPSASLMAHSLGTSVGHDLLANLADPADAALNPWRAGAYQLKSFFTVANVSRVLQTEPKVFASKVRPGTRANDRYVNRYLNFMHSLDPFPYAKRFVPTTDWQDGRYDFITVDHLLDFNVHGYDHYLKHPLVHANIINRLYTSTKITRDEMLAAVDNKLQAEQAAFVAQDAARAQQWLQELGAFNAEIPLWNALGVEDLLKKWFPKMVDYIKKLPGLV